MEIELSFDLGPRATLSQLSSLTSQVAQATDLALRWASISLRQQAEADVNMLDLGFPSRDRPSGSIMDLVPDPFRREVAAYYSLGYQRGPSRFASDPDRAPFMPLRSWAPTAFEAAVDARLASQPNDTPSVASLRYQNPWEVVLTAVSGGLGGLSLRSLLVLFRDWRADADKATAQAAIAGQKLRMVTAQASQEESKARILQIVADRLERNDVLTTHAARLALEDHPEAAHTIAGLLALGPEVTVNDD